MVLTAVADEPCSVTRYITNLRPARLPLAVPSDSDGLKDKKLALPTAFYWGNVTT